MKELLGLQHGSRLSKLLDDQDDNWREEATCKGLDPDIFFPVGINEDDYERAKAICRQCPVREDCLEYALTTRQDDGIWGGRTEDERRIIRRNNGAPRKTMSRPTRD